jgi:predicted nucleic acid-binding protein
VRRILIDTGIYVDWFRWRRHQEIMAGRQGPPSLSAVVATELLAGERRNERLAEWVERFVRARRLLIPDWQVWRLTARVLRELRLKGRDPRTLANDVLIAMTARAFGLRLFTTNRRDFEAIASIEPFELVVVA